jgi:hypothetical protein
LRERRVCDHLTPYRAKEIVMAKAPPKTRKTEAPGIAAERGITLGIARANHLAAAERDARLAPILRRLSHLSSEKTVAELQRLGFNWMSHSTIRRARARLGIPSRPAPGKGAAKPHRRQAPKKTNEEAVASAGAE